MNSTTDTTNSKTTDRAAEAPWPVAEAAKFLSVSERTLTRAIRSEKLKSIKLGRRRLIPDREVRRVAAEGFERTRTE